MSDSIERLIERLRNLAQLGERDSREWVQEIRWTVCQAADALESLRPKPEPQAMRAEEVIEIDEDGKVHYPAGSTMSAEEVREACARTICKRCEQGEEPFQDGAVWKHFRPGDLMPSPCDADAIRSLDLSRKEKAK